MGKKLVSGYYSKMLFYCIVIVITITIALYLLSSSLIKNQEKNEYLKKYDIEISNLSSILSTKKNSMANNLSPVFSSASRYESLCRLYLESDSPDSSTTYSIVQMLKELCRYDQYCRGVLLRTGNGRLFQYDTRYDTLVPIPLNTEMRDFTPFELQVLSDAQLESLSEQFEKPSNHVYGLSNTIFSYIGNDMLPIGQLIVLYDTSEFTNSLFDSKFDQAGLFTITDKNHNIIYASDNNYSSANHLIFTKSYPSDNNTIETGATSHILNGEKYYHASTYHSQYDYYTSYQVPASLVGGGFFQMILAIAVIFTCFTAIIIYILTLRISNKKIKAIQEGMNLVGQNNLDYRLPVPKSNDEFTRIIKNFNEMCDELQWNVKRAYQYEISQKKAELYAMQTSINPHFLYNTLEQIRVQITQGNFSDASQMLLLLSKMYRTQTRRNLYVSIGEELELCENLINLYMYRYGNFEYEYVISSSLKKYGIPKNTLQPLIENYFVHGLVLGHDDNMITISVQSVYDQGKEYLEFHIDDNGASLPTQDIKSLEEKLAEPVLDRDEENGFALPNVNTRLKLVFGEESRLRPSIGANGRGFRISFRIPPILPQDLQ